MSSLKKTKPKVLLVSTKDSKNVSDAIIANLEKDVHFQLWDTGMTQMGRVVSSKFEENIKEVEAGIFVFSLKDQSPSKSGSFLNTRDKVVFKMGSFAKERGWDRCFLLFPNENSEDFPQDLIGIPFGYYDPTHDKLKTAVRTFCMNFVDQLKQLQEPKEPQNLHLPPDEEITETEHIWNLRIRNRKGDATVIKRTTFEVNFPTFRRDHEVFSDSSSQTEENLCLEAYTDAFETLNVNIDEDVPNRKQFTVDFGRKLEKGEEFTYYYKYEWDNLFPQGERYFIIKNNFHSIKLELLAPKTFSQLKKFLIRGRSEKSRTWRKITSIKPQMKEEGRQFNRFDVVLKNIPKSHKQIRFDWEFEKI